MPASYRKPSQALAGGAPLSLAPSPCDLLLFTRNFHVYICLPRRRNSGQIQWSPLSAQHAAWCPAGSPEEERIDGWLGPAPSKPPAIFLPLTSQPVQPRHVLNLTALGEPACGRGTQAPPPDSLFSGAWWGWQAERRGSRPFGNTEFCPHDSLSFKIPPPDVFQASHFSGVTRQRGLFLPPSRLREDPGSVSTLTGAPER